MRKKISIFLLIIHLFVKKIQVSLFSKLGKHKNENLNYHYHMTNLFYPKKASKETQNIVVNS